MDCVQSKYIYMHHIRTKLEDEVNSYDTKIRKKILLLPPSIKVIEKEVERFKSLKVDHHEYLTWYRLLFDIHPVKQ